MLQFLSPLALLTLAALAIPAILHLWRPPPTTIRVGTLRFFSGPAVRRLTKLRWRELLLLAVRLLLLTMVALLLAQPIWRKAPPTKQQRWALLEPGIELTGEALKRWRELDRDGFETRELAPGFRASSPAAARNRQVSGLPDVWSLLRELDAMLPQGSKVAVFSRGHIASLHGERPQMRRADVEWVALPAPTSPASIWIHSVNAVAAENTAEPRLRVIVSASDASRTANKAVLVENAPGTTALAPPLEGWSIEVAGSGNDLSARLVRTGDAQQWVRASEPKPLRIALLATPERAEDARYVEAALRAIAETTGRPFIIDGDVPAAEWVFWLSDDPAPPHLLDAVKSRGVTLLSDAERSGETARAVVTTVGADVLVERAGLFRRVPPRGDDAATLWTDGFGTPLLSVRQDGVGRSLGFFSRFHPDWNDLPRSSALATALRPLLLREEVGPAVKDERRADNGQGAPATLTATDGSAGTTLTAAGDTVDLHRLLWFFCLALFAVERALSHRNALAQQQPAPTATRKPEPALVEHA